MCRRLPGHLARVASRTVPPAVSPLPYSYVLLFPLCLFAICMMTGTAKQRIRDIPCLSVCLCPSPLHLLLLSPLSLTKNRHTISHLSLSIPFVLTHSLTALPLQFLYQIDADGSLVAVFGGFINGAATADPNAYILNTVTWTWTAIPVASGRGRGNAACTIIDDTFIIWGGFYNNPSVAGGLPSGLDNLLLLSLSTGQWKTSYTPSMAAGGAGTGGGGNGGNGGMGGNGGTGGGKGGLSSGAIGGICAGVAVVIAAVAFLFFRRTWKKGDDAVAASSAKLESGSHGAPHPPAPPCTGGGPTNGHGQHHNGGGAAPTAAVAGAAPGHIQSNHHNHSPQPPASSTTVSPTVYDQSLYNQQQPQQIGYTGYDQHQQQYPPYLQQAPDHTFHHRPSTDIPYSSAGAPGNDVQYLDENGNLYRRSYQPEVGPAPVPSPGTVYYPPPPPSGSSVGTPEQGAYQVAYGQGQGGEAPYKASIGEGGAPRVDASPYHDSYGVAGSATTGGVKRPVGGPQGGPYIEVPVTKGAPQAILQ